MTRIRFEDLPSTNTPRNAENLNKLNNVVISSTEPTTGEEMWIKKGKNLYDKNASLDGYSLLSATGELKPNSPTWTASDFMPVKPNVKVSLSGKPTQGNGVCFYDKNRNFVQTITLPSGTTTVPNNAYYVRINLAITDKDTCQFEISDDITSYEPYVDRAIVVEGEEIFTAIKSKTFDSVTTTSGGYFNLNLKSNECSIIGYKFNGFADGAKIETYSDNSGSLFLRTSANNTYGAYTINKVTVYYI